MLKRKKVELLAMNAVMEAEKSIGRNPMMLVIKGV